MRILAAIVVMLLGLSSAFGQALIQSGPWTTGHAPGYSGSHGAVPLVQDSGPAGGAGPGLSEGLYVQPPTGGTGPFGTNWCDYDAPVASGAYHYLCLSPNASGGGTLAYGAIGGAPSELLSFYINGVKYNFPIALSGILGPVSSTVGDMACWNNTSGTLLYDCLNSVYDVERAGLAPGGQDNSPFVAGLMTAIMPPNVHGGAFGINFPAIPGQTFTPYYFSNELSISRGGTWSCSGFSSNTAVSGVFLVFAAGVDGVRFEDNNTSSDGGNSQGATLTNCPVYSLGYGVVPIFLAGATTLTPVMQNAFSSVGIPTPSWGAGDGFILAAHQASYGISAGSVSGIQLTVTTISFGTITVGSSWTATNALPNTYITACPISGCGTPGVYTLSQSQPATVTSPGASITGYNLTWAPVVPSGAYIDSASGVAPSQTITIHSGFTPTQGGPHSANAIWRLPANEAWTITTTTGAGSQFFTVTAAPSANPNGLLEPGDFIWAAPYAIGCVVYGVTGAAGAQTIKLAQSAMSGASPEPQCDSTLSGSFQLWKVPSAFRPIPQSQAQNNLFQNFPIGLNQESTTGMSPPYPGGGIGQNATTSLFVKNTTTDAMIGFLNGGGNSGASTWVGNEGFNNYIVDFAENGTVGSDHIGDNSNSTEGGTAPTSIIGNCSNGNGSGWFGNYIGTPAPAQPFCVPSTGMLFAAPDPLHFGNQVLWNAVSGGPSIMPKVNILGMSNFGNFAFGPGNGQPGMYFNSTVTSLYPGGLLSKDGLHGVGYDYNSAIDAWQTNTPSLTGNSTSADCWIGTAYTGYYGIIANVPYHCFMNGLLLGGSGVVTGGERLVDAGTVAPTDTDSATITASQAFMAGSIKLAVSTATGVTALYSVVDTTISASSAIGTVASANSTQNWITLSADSSITSTGPNDTLLANGVTTITAGDQFDVTMTMIPVSTCTGVSGTLTDTTQGGASVGTVSSCGTQATLVAKAGVTHASSGMSDSLTIVQRRQGDLRVNLGAGPGSPGCWMVTDYAGGVRQGCPISNSLTNPDYTATAIRSGSASNKDIAGRIALSGGTQTFTLLETYATAPVCLCADATTPANACSVSESTTTLTFTGTSTDTVKWQCVGRN